jgi:LmbE family N-acetylglucosaminyl deacetylase
MLNYNKVLVLSPHPDDAEYGMLGSMGIYKDTQFDVFVLSQGGDFDSSTAKTRHDETRKVLEHFDNTSVEFSDVKFIKSKSEDEWVNIIENKYNLDEYDCVLTPPSHDAHFEHRMINKLSEALIRVTKCGLVSYRTPSTTDLWIPNYFVDLNVIVNRDKGDGHPNGTHLLFSAGIWYVKLNKMKEFESQSHKTYFSEESIKSFHSNYQCSTRGMTSVESFKIIRGYN